MDPGLVIFLVYAAAAAAASAGSIAGMRHRVGRTAEASRLVAETAGLTDVEVSPVSSLNPSTRLRGRSGPLDVEIVTGFLSGEGGQRSVIVIGGLADLSLTTEGVRTSVSRSLGGLEIHVGDPSFDDTLFVRGSEPLVRAVLDAETRRLALLLFERRVGLHGHETTLSFESEVSISSGRLRVEAANVISSPKWLGGCLQGLIDVAHRLARPADIAGRLAANATHDPLSAVRLANLQVLQSEYPGRPATRSALRSALNDPDLDVRLWAAEELGDEALPVLQEIAGSTRVEEEAQTRALWALGGRLPLGDGVEILSQALRSRRLPVAEACLAALGEKGGADVVPLLAKVLLVERGWLAVAAARALGASGDASAEAPLVAALQGADEDVAAASATALGRVGTASAVPRLRAVESSSDDETLRRAAREAVAQIQERLTGASPGQLSLSEGSTGQLSLTEDEAGRLTLLDGAKEAPGGDDPRSEG